MSIETHIEDIRKAIKAGHFTNEASVSQGIVLRLLQALAWSIYDPQVVCPEYKLQGRRVDYALCHPTSKPIAFIEVKQIGQSEGAEKQLFEYAFHVGIPLAILTDGQEWNFFLPAEQGSYDERRVYKLDIMQRDLSECAARLTRYLHYDAVASGEAIKAAREDYRNVSRERQIETTLPEAWARLISEEDDSLLELIADRVALLCGFKPDLKTVAYFLKGKSNIKNIPLTVVQSAISQPTVKHTINISDKTNPVNQSFSSTGFILNGQFYPARNACGVMVSVFEELTKRNPSFPEQFAALPKHGSTRRYLTQKQEDLNPERPDLARRFSIKLTSGWWLGNNYNRGRIELIIKMACEVAKLQYGKDLLINLGEYMI